MLCAVASRSNASSVSRFCAVPRRISIGRSAALIGASCGTPSPSPRRSLNCPAHVRPPRGQVIEYTYGYHSPPILSTRDGIRRAGSDGIVVHVPSRGRSSATE
jgi:hypothetical protein